MGREANIINNNYADIHAGHRDRLRKRYFDQGPESLADHELLELLLFYAIPRRDTNKIAHKIIQDFGNLVNLMDAHPKEIKNRSHISTNTAILISMLLEFNKRYTKNSGYVRSDLSSVVNVAAYLSPLFVGKRYELVYIMCLDSENRLIQSAMLDEGSINHIVIDPQKVARIALGNYSSSIIIAHNHPSGNVLPTTDDIETTKRLYTTLKLLRIQLVDHIIIAGKQYYSFAENNKLSGIDTIQ